MRVFVDVMTHFYFLEWEKKRFLGYKKHKKLKLYLNALKKMGLNA